MEGEQQATDQKPYADGGFAGPGPGTVDAVAATKTWRRDLDAILQSIKTHGTGTSRERALCFTNIQLAIMWLGMDLKERRQADPYPESYDPKSPVIEKTADGLKL